MKLKLYRRGAIAAMLMLAAAASYAGHHKGDHEGDHKAHIDVLTERLQLTDEQVPQVEAILADAKAQRQAIGDSYTLNQRDEARVAMRQLHEQMMANMKAVLNDEQAAKLEKMHEQRMHRREHRREHRHEHRRMKDAESDEA